MGKFALLIGVSESSEKDLPALPSAIEDIKAMQAVLQNPEMGGFDRVERLLNPTRQEMEEAIETLFANCKKEDLVLFYFSGHGITDEKGKLLVTPQTRKERGNLRKATAVAGTVLHDNMGNSRSKHQVLILDSCFSGAIAEGLTGKSAGSKVDIQRELGGEGRVILTSSNAVQESFHIQGYNLSIYTHYLIEGIQTGAANQDGDDYISVDELHEYVKKKLEQEAPLMSPQFFPVKEGYKIRLVRSPKVIGKSEFNSAQHPLDVEQDTYQHSKISDNKNYVQSNAKNLSCQVFVQRTSQLTGRANKWDVRCDGSSKAWDLANGCTLSFTVEPGEHEFQVDYSQWHPSSGMHGDRGGIEAGESNLLKYVCRENTTLILQCYYAPIWNIKAWTTEKIILKVLEVK
jgi:Caspase domain